jgi:hypothetical protein
LKNNYKQLILMEMKTKLFITPLTLMAITVFATAQNQGNGRGNGRCNGTGKGAAFVDANKNGICDNNEKGTANFSGKKGNGKGKTFVDANKNGICDNKENLDKK